VNRPFYEFAKGTVRVIFTVLWRYRIEGAERVPRSDR